MKQSYCVKCKKRTASKPVQGEKLKKTKNGKTYFRTKCGSCGSFKSRFLSKAELKKIKGKGFIGDLVKGIANIIPI